MNPFKARALSLQLTKAGILLCLPAMIASLLNIGYGLLDAVFFIGLAALFAGMLIRILFWRCPHCRTRLRGPVDKRCPRCGQPLE